MSANLPDLPEFLLLTWFGTIPCFDSRRRRLTHVVPEALDSSFLPLGMKRLEETGDSPAFAPAGAGWAKLPPMQTGKGKQLNCLVFERNQVFLIAKPDGKLELGSKEAREFENFLPLATADFMALRGILPRHWRLEEGKPLSTGLDRFQLKIGPYNAALAQNTPLNCDAAFETLELATPAGKLSFRSAIPEPEPPTIWINPNGNIGNRALQYLAAVGLASRVPGVRIENFKLEMWDFVAPAPRPQPWKLASTGTLTHLDMDGLADCLNRREVETVCINGFVFHLDHYPPRAICRQLLPAAHGTEGVRGFGPHELVCSVRAAEILKSVHPDYFPLPPGYYAKLQEESGLDLVFFGQLGDDAYSASLRAAFPKARFIPGVNQNHDFEVLRRSRNVALSISTFAWLAAWLGEAERIYLPVGGMFSPVQWPDQAYLPLAEPAYRYVLLPPVSSVDLYMEPERFRLMQDILASQARFAGAGEILELVNRSAGVKQTKITVKGFDSVFYLAQNPDAAIGVRALQETALTHYLRAGAKEKRLYRPFDALFYASKYPDAAEAVALGHYPSLFAHFIEAGERKGYAPVP